MNSLDWAFSKAIPVPESGCWMWLGNINDSGYAMGRPEKKQVRIHRWLYQEIHGSVGDLTLDHLCRVRCCINPAHLEPVTLKVNSLRGQGAPANNARRSTCKNGHPFDRIVRRASGAIVRRCWLCQVTRDKQYKRKPKGEKK